jgi:hypothetical protein
MQDLNKRNSVTFTLNKKNHFDLGIRFEFGEILEANINGHRIWTMVTRDSNANEENGSVTISLKKLNVSRIPIIRRIQLKIFRSLLKNK